MGSSFCNVIVRFDWLKQPKVNVDNKITAAIRYRLRMQHSSQSRATTSAEYHGQCKQTVSQVSSAKKSLLREQRGQCPASPRQAGKTHVHPSLQKTVVSKGTVGSSTKSYTFNSKLWPWWPQKYDTIFFQSAFIIPTSPLFTLRVEMSWAPVGLHVVMLRYCQ